RHVTAIPRAMWRRSGPIHWCGCVAAHAAVRPTLRAIRFVTAFACPGGGRMGRLATTSSCLPIFVFGAMSPSSCATSPVSSNSVSSATSTTSASSMSEGTSSRPRVTSSTSTSSASIASSLGADILELLPGPAVGGRTGHALVLHQLLRTLTDGQGRADRADVLLLLDRLGGGLLGLRLPDDLGDGALRLRLRLLRCGLVDGRLGQQREPGDHHQAVDH